MRLLHGWLTVAWFVAAIPICIYLYDSVPFLVFISVYAVVTGHWSSWQAARVEEKQDEAADTILDQSGNATGDGQVAVGTGKTKRSAI